MNISRKTPVGNYLEWSHEGKSAIWRYVLAFFLGFLIWLWGSVIPMLLVFKPLNIGPLTDSVAFYYTFIVGLIGIPLVVRLLPGRPAYSVALPSWPSNLADYGIGILIVATLPVENAARHSALFVFGQSLIALIIVEVIFRQRLARVSN